MFEYTLYKYFVHYNKEYKDLKLGNASKFLDINMDATYIMKTSPCNEDPPYTPLLYNKTGVYRGIHFFLIFALNIDCGYSLETPH